MLLPGIGSRVRDSGVWPFSNSVLRVAAELRAIPGVAAVGEPESRAGDLTFRNNVFFTVFEENTLSSTETTRLVDAISATLATAQGSTRFMVELDLGEISVGISPIAGLNADRLELASDLAQLDGVVRATVLWPDQNDDLIIDESNSSLNVWVQARAGSPLALLDLVRPYLGVTDPPQVTAVILGSNPVRERVYSWGAADDIEGGTRQLTVQGDDAALWHVIGQLENAEDVSGYIVHHSGAFIAFDEGVDVRDAISALSVPTEWQYIEALTPAGKDEWAQEHFNVRVETTPEGT
ncbi:MULTISPECIES: hypothetical protein [Cryobacterium]|uniref:DUF695 domain-containing protein n=1 Tax=Cryobacterium breve TaxID=1259258 RepID=A0ABY2IVT9_9MICO|nr:MULTISPECIES: hypothetical protein [Cryobacterium]TFC95893.1 hypothetical protein E3O65_14340 [Cryobacterium breve]TFC98030.1 hypothetical protein E3T20_00425 [Cryobacterium sp. TmT3-12]